MGGWLSALRTSRKAKLIVTGVGVVVLAAAGGFWFFNSREKTDDKTANQNTNTAAVAQARRAIDGVMDAADRERNFPIAVMIENLAAARPQAGLDEANLVFEALAEGGITRFLAFFTLESRVDKIGPVRSARPYYVDWVGDVDALYAHAGGSPAAMTLIRSANIRDLDQFYNGRYFWRDPNRKTAREHTLYTDSKLLVRAKVDKKVPKESSFVAWTYKDAASPVVEPAAATTITIPFSTFTYQVKWKFDPQTNTYHRYQAGEEHVMENGNAIVARNVVVEYVKTRLADGEHLAMDTIGTGQAVVYRDGQAITGTWEKEGRNTRTVFKDDSGQIITLNAGTTWVEIVPTDRNVTIEK